MSAWLPIDLSRIKICLVSWAPFLAGAEIAAERLARGLRDAGHDVLVMIGTDGPVLARMQQSGFRCIHVPLVHTDRRSWWSYLRAQRALHRLWAQERPQLVHSNDLPTHQMVSRAAGRLGIPRICHHRWIFGQTAIDWLNKYGAERHLFVSQALMSHLCGESTRLTQSPCRVVYDGLPLPQVPSPTERQTARRQLGLSANKTTVLFAGQIVERKGVADLLQAWMLIAEQLRDRAELLIVGDDPQSHGGYRVEMERLAREIGCSASFPGFQTDVWQWLTAADLVVVPSHAEPLGNATLEAMSCGLPVIGCDVGGIPEMIVSEDTGLLVPPHNPPRLAAALDRLLADESLRLRLGTAGRTRCEQLFNLQTHVNSIVKQYRSVLGHHDPQR